MKDLSFSKVPGGGAPERSGVERSETERSAGAPPPRQNAEGLAEPRVAAAPNPEVLEKPQRRRISAADKLRILHEVDRCTQPGQIGALLRREGIYSSYLQKWRKQRDAGALGALHGQKRGPRSSPPNPLAKQLAQSQKDNARLERKLKRAEAIIDFQKKIAAMLNIPMRPFEDEEND
jgi:transposase-like protein